MNKVPWLSIPPVVAIPTIMLSYLLSSGERSYLSFSVWSLIITFFLVVTLIYVWASAKGLHNWCTPLQFMAQGALLAPFAIEFGQQYLSWVAVLLILIGLVLSASIVFSGNADTETLDTVRIIKEHEEIFEKSPLPQLVTDLGEGVIAVSSGLIRLLGKTKEEILSINPNDILPPDGQLGGKRWVLSRQENEGRIWFSLAEERKAENESTIIPLIDTESNIYSSAYSRMRSSDEIARIKRYKRWGIFLLIKFDFVYASTSPLSADAKQKSFFRSYCAFIKSSLRNCDIISKVGEFSILAYLPETTSGDSLNQVLSKISAINQPLGDLINSIPGEIKMKVGSVFFNSSMLEMDYDGLMNSLNDGLFDYQYT